VGVVSSWEGPAGKPHGPSPPIGPLGAMPHPRPADQTGGLLTRQKFHRGAVERRRG